MSRKTTVVAIPYEFSATGLRKGGRSPKPMQVRRTVPLPVALIPAADAVPEPAIPSPRGTVLVADGRCWFPVVHDHGPVREEGWAGFVERFVDGRDRGENFHVPFEIGMQLFGNGTALSHSDYMARLVDDDRVRSIERGEEAAGLRRAAFDADCLAFVDGVLHTSRFEYAVEHDWEPGGRSRTVLGLRRLILPDEARLRGSRRVSFAPADAAAAAVVLGVGQASAVVPPDSLVETVAPRLAHLEMTFLHDIELSIRLVAGDGQTRSHVMGGLDEAPAVADAVDACRAARRRIVAADGEPVDRFEAALDSLDALSEAMEAIPIHRRSAPEMHDDRVAICRRPRAVWDAVGGLTRAVPPSPDDVDAFEAMSLGAR